MSLSLGVELVDSAFLLGVGVTVRDSLGRLSVKAFSCRNRLFGKGLESSLWIAGLRFM